MRHDAAVPRRAGSRAATGGLATLTAVALLLPAGLAAQGVPCDAPPDGIRITGEVEAPVTITRDQMRAMQTVTVTAIGHDGTERTYQGPTLRALLDRAGVPGGAGLEGHLDGYVVIEARDGYRVTFALAELDGGYWDQLPILAFRRDGETLDEHAGPFQVIAPDTPKHGRWARQVACFHVGYADW